MINVKQHIKRNELSIALFWKTTISNDNVCLNTVGDVDDKVLALWRLKFPNKTINKTPVQLLTILFDGVKTNDFRSLKKLSWKLRNNGLFNFAEYLLLLDLLNNDGNHPSSTNSLTIGELQERISFVKQLIIEYKTMEDY